MVGRTDWQDWSLSSCRNSGPVRLLACNGDLKEEDVGGVGEVRMGLRCGQMVFQGLHTQSADVPKIPDPGVDIIWGICPALTPFSEISLALHQCGLLLLGKSYLDQVQTADPEDISQSLCPWDLEFELGKRLGQLAVGPGLT